MKRVYYSVLCLATLAVAACNKEGVQTAGESLCANAYISSSATKTVYEIGNYGEKRVRRFRGAMPSLSRHIMMAGQHLSSSVKLPQVLRLLQSPFRKVFPYLLHLQACTVLRPH